MNHLFKMKDMEKRVKKYSELEKESNLIFKRLRKTIIFSYRKGWNTLHATFSDENCNNKTIYNIKCIEKVSELFEKYNDVKLMITIRKDNTQVIIFEFNCK